MPPKGLLGGGGVGCRGRSGGLGVWGFLRVRLFFSSPYKALGANMTPQEKNKI